MKNKDLKFLGIVGRAGIIIMLIASLAGVALSIMDNHIRNAVVFGVWSLFPCLLLWAISEDEKNYNRNDDEDEDDN